MNEQIISVTLTTEQRQFHLEEFKLLKAEVLAAFKESQQIIFFSVAANSAIVSFIASHTNSNYLVRLIPLFITILSYWIYILRRILAGRIAVYLRRIESQFASPDFRWEESNRVYLEKRKWYTTTPAVTNIFMGMQFIYCIIIAFNFQLTT